MQQEGPRQATNHDPNKLVLFMYYPTNSICVSVENSETEALAVTPAPPIFQPLMATQLLSVCVDIPVLNTSQKWGHKIFDLLHLAALILHWVSKVHSWLFKVK
jgi:hypothetical protein